MIRIPNESARAMEGAEGEKAKAVMCLSSLEKLSTMRVGVETPESKEERRNREQRGEKERAEERTRPEEGLDEGAAAKERTSPWCG